MTREEFDALVSRVETRYKDDEGQLRARTVRWAFIGYSGLCSSLVAVVLFAAVFIGPALTLKFWDAWILYVVGVCILVFGGWAVMKVLWVQLEPPKGLPVSRNDFPALFAALDELRGRLRSAPFHRVIIVPECNAAVVQEPRLGVFGFPRNHLLLGLPLLESLSPEEFRAVLGHEFTHLSRAHGRFGNWIYRLRYSWAKVFEDLSRPRIEGEASLRPLITKFVDWFWPQFNAHAFVLSRSNEYEADRVAAELTSPVAMASALRRVRVAGRFFREKFLADLWLRANKEAEPPAAIFQMYPSALRSAAGTEEVARWEQEAFKALTTNADTHPCLTDRLRALGCLPRNTSDGLCGLVPKGPSAAEFYLGGGLEAMRGDVGREWSQTVHENWRERHGRALALNQRLSSLQAAVVVPEANADSLWDKAHATLDLEGDVAAEPMLRRLLQMRPDHVAGNFSLGRILLERNEAEGEALVERAMAESDEVFGDSCNVLHAYFRRTGQAERIKKLTARVDQFEKSVTESYRERSSISDTDRILPHGLDVLQLAQLRELLGREQCVTGAYLAQKELKHFPKQRMFLLCIQVRPKFLFLGDSDAETAVINRLIHELRLPGRFFAFGSSGGYKALGKRVRLLAGADVYRR